MPTISTTRKHSPKLGIGSVSLLELDCLKATWELFGTRRHGVTVKDVFEELYEKRRLAYTTTLTVMGRLVEKELLRVNRVPGQYLYAPCVTADELRAGLVGEIDRELR